MYFAEHSATISPDGERVVFAAQGDHLGLYVVDAEGGQPTPLPYPSYGWVGSPTFSPDGSQIAYLAGNGEPQVWVADADGTDAHEILANEPTVFGGVSGLEWSPAGDRLAIGLGDFKGSAGLAIYTFAPDGSDFTRVITDGISPYWSPDGSQIAYTIPCDEHPNASCPEGSRRRAQFDPQPGGSPPASRSPMRTAPTSGSSASRLRAPGIRPRSSKGERDEATRRTHARVSRAGGVAGSVRIRARRHRGDGLRLILDGSDGPHADDPGHLGRRGGALHGSGAWHGTALDPDLDSCHPAPGDVRGPPSGWQSWIGAAKLSDAGWAEVSITTVTNLVTHGCRDHSWADPPVGSSVEDLAASLEDLAPFRVTSPPRTCPSTATAGFTWN